MYNDKNRNFMIVLPLCISGFLLTLLIESDTVAAEIVIFIVFIANITLLYNDKLLLIKNKIRAGLAAFVFGALAGIIIT